MAWDPLLCFLPWLVRAVWACCLAGRCHLGPRAPHVLCGDSTAGGAQEHEWVLFELHLGQKIPFCPLMPVKAEPKRLRWKLRSNALTHHKARQKIKWK